MKLKTSKSATKRIAKFTKKGKIIRRKMAAQHLRQGKSKRTKKLAGKFTTVSKTDSKKIKKLVPYKK